MVSPTGGTTMDRREVASPDELAKLDGLRVYVQPRCAPFGARAAVLRKLPWGRQWSVGFLSHDYKKIVRARFFLDAAEVLSTFRIWYLCI